MISAVILTHNDEKTISRTLKSLQWCDERIVIDDCSHDKTLEIVKQYGVLVYTKALSGDFATQRNFGLSKATGDWIFFVDSDEVVSEELQKEISLAVRKDNVSGYMIRRLDTIFGRSLNHGEAGNIRLLRLAKKGTGEWKRSVHETWDIHGETQTLHEPLHHFPHPDVAQFLDEINMYSTLHAKVLYDEGIRTNGWQVWAYPLVKFKLNYILRLGFLDGMAGMIVAVMMSFHSFLARSKLYLLSKNAHE
jgi:glycosyltransferase involved in cell wall biosynthesis